MKTKLDKSRDVVRFVVSAVSDLTGVPVAQITGRDRCRSPRLVRQVAMHLCWNYGVPIRHIGYWFGSREYNTIRYNISTFGKIINSVPKACTFYQEIKEKIDEMIRKRNEIEMAV